jgi:hypothetical protein
MGDSSLFPRGLSVTDGLARLPPLPSFEGDCADAEAAPRIGRVSLTSDPKRLARAATRSSSGVMTRGGPMLCAAGF